MNTFPTAPASLASVSSYPLFEGQPPSMTTVSPFPGQPAYAKGEKEEEKKPFQMIINKLNDLLKKNI
uniref:Uncharacterized protein n=1 Tax=Caenorhabditis tropicalis TaxID=1561998 RepID=A0A1I7UH64_9PELO